MPSTANPAAHGVSTKAPTSTSISETNGESPGSESVDSPVSRNNPASTGATFSTPPKSLIRAEPRLLIRKPVTRNSAAVERPWLNM
jgi:hypothetical protein